MVGEQEPDRVRAADRRRVQGEAVKEVDKVEVVDERVGNLHEQVRESLGGNHGLVSFISVLLSCVMVQAWVGELGTTAEDVGRHLQERAICGEGMSPHPANASVRSVRRATISMPWA